MLRSRVMLAVIGLLLIGGTSASIAVLTTNRPTTTVPGTAQGNPTSASGTATSTSASQNDTPTATLPPPTQPVPTATQPSAPPPTATPRTAPPPGQSVDLHGTITNKSTSTFTYRDTTGAVWTISVSQSTQYQGAATDFSQLQVDMLAEIVGQTTGGFNLLASNINSQRDN